jgi:rare lipoprotein A
MYFKNLKRSGVILTTASLFVLIVTITGLHAGEASPKGARSVTQKASSPADAQKGKVAKATYYADRYNGRKTSSGERYDSKKLTAAHPTLPFGKRVKVVNLANGRSVIVTINDRYRKHKYEAIDVSLAAAQELGIIRQGIAKVRIIPVDG